MEFIEDAEDLAQTITSLTLQIRTGDAHQAGTDDFVFCNVVFTDGSLLFNHLNHRLNTSGHNDFEAGATKRFPLPLPENFAKTIGEIQDFYIRKGSNPNEGWLLGGALLFANENFDLAVMGNDHINEFLDAQAHTLYRRDWSPRSISVSSVLPAKYPVFDLRYRIAGPVLGQISATSARILYRVDQEGTYRINVFENGSEPPVFTATAVLSPTGTFLVPSLTPNTHYRYRFSRVFAGRDIPMPDGDGEFRTYPSVGSGARFGFAFGSCSRNRDDVAQNAWSGIRNLAAPPQLDAVANPPRNVRFFLQLGDTFYFYDDVTGEAPTNRETVQAAHLSQRRHPHFLDMARALPSCAIWDDHDFRENSKDSHGFETKAAVLAGFREYWGNDALDPENLGLTTLVTLGNVDVYVMDGRFLRETSKGICFTLPQINRILNLIAQRGAITPRLVILASGSTWNHKNTDSAEQAYGNRVYETERETFYRRLNALIGGPIQGLVFLSGDIHRNEIFEISLHPGAGGEERVAPEFVSSPLGNNTLYPAGEIEGERKWSMGSKNGGRVGFATLEIDTISELPEDWTITIRYYDANASVTEPYKTQAYTLSEGQFKFVA